MAKKVSKEDLTPAQTKANKDIAETIHYFYTTIHNIKPDVTHYKSGHKILHKLMYPEYDNVRTYTFEEIKKVIDALKENDLKPDSFTILLWPDLVRSIISGDLRQAKKLLEALRREFMGSNVYSDLQLEKMKPRGW